ncbi:uncharacterized protein BDV14DRAFT_176823 [Aspergillus stella-maris]|uniref:uncharacterized protein n=1 Tax=Aspergillus stella-maris TaxID=1810926 RepID=UPI003CCCFC53
MAQWLHFWDPPSRRILSQGRNLVYMVLAIGASVSESTESIGPNSASEWAEYLSRKQIFSCLP